MRWYGHMLRLPYDAPVRLSLVAAESKVKKPMGRGCQVETWLAQIMKDQHRDIGGGASKGRKTAPGEANELLKNDF